MMGRARGRLAAICLSMVLSVIQQLRCHYNISKPFLEFGIVGLSQPGIQCFLYFEVRGIPWLIMDMISTYRISIPNRSRGSRFWYAYSQRRNEFVAKSRWDYWPASRRERWA